jgi:hypothetical protein
MLGLRFGSTERGPGSPAGQPRWGGGCAGC